MLIHVFFRVITIASIQTSPAAQSAEEVIAKHIAALGGQEALHSITTRRLTLDLTSGSGDRVELAVEKKRPNKIRVEYTPTVGATGVEGFDGETAWESNPFDDLPDPRKLKGGSALALERAAEFDGPLVDYQTKGHLIELVGTRVMEQRPAHELKVTLKDGNTIHYFVDGESYLVLKTVTQRIIHGGPAKQSVTTKFSDYRNIDGIVSAFCTEESTPDGHAETARVTALEVNVDLPDSRFTFSTIPRFTGVPDQWRPETIPFPLAFAPGIELEGIEELRFAPGMMDSHSETYFTYVFLWWLEGRPDLDREVLEEYLLQYFQGLYEAVSKKEVKDVSEFWVDLEQADREEDQDSKAPRVKHLGVVEWVDPFVTEESLTLHLRVEQEFCKGQDHTLLFFALSPQPEDHQVWKTLNQIKTSGCD